MVSFDWWLFFSVEFPLQDCKTQQQAKSIIMHIGRRMQQANISINKKTSRSGGFFMFYTF
jgi:hypothetical protein